MQQVRSYMPSPDRWRNTLVRSPLVAVLLALLVGVAGGAAAALGPIYAVAALVALAAGYAVLTSTELAMLAVFAILTMLPFGTLPFRAIVTPNLHSLAMAGLLSVWVLRLLARSDTYDLRLSPIGLPLLGFLGLTFFSLVLGAGGLPDTATLHNYAKFVLGVLFFFSLVNCVRTRQQARFVTQALIITGGAAALIGLLLYVLNDQTALRLLTSLGRVGYPTSGRVLRYIEDDSSGLQRAIGTSVDPNSFGGLLALVCAVAIAQLFAARPVLPRWSLLGLTGTMGLALLLTFSRAALLGLVFAVVYLALVRYRRLWWAMVAGGLVTLVLLVGLGIAGEFVQRFSDGLQFRDQAQQMRLAEYQNAVAIIQRYPVFGIGFGMAPDIDLVAGVSSMYLAIAQRLGLVGLAAFTGIVGAWFWVTWQALPQCNEEQASWVLGAQAGIVAALAVGLADHYFFNIEFSHMVALFWGCAGLGMAACSLDTDDRHLSLPGASPELIEGTRSVP